MKVKKLNLGKVLKSYIKNMIKKLVTPVIIVLMQLAKAKDFCKISKI
jgi:hypothetical protein